MASVNWQLIAENLARSAERKERDLAQIEEATRASQLPLAEQLKKALLEIATLKAANVARTEKARAANRKLKPCPACGRPATARERRRACSCGRKWPMKEK